MHCGSSKHIFLNHTLSSTQFNILKAIRPNMAFNSTKMASRSKVGIHTIALSKHLWPPSTLSCYWMLKQLSPLWLSQVGMSSRLSMKDPMLSLWDPLLWRSWVWGSWLRSSRLRRSWLWSSSLWWSSCWSPCLCLLGGFTNFNPLG